VSPGLVRVREAAERDKDAQFTALLHHVTVEALRDAYRALRPRAAAGVDGATWAAYGENLETNLQDLHQRLHSGAFRAKPVRRVYIPKADGRQRPLGIASLEDEIAQSALVGVLNSIYEADFLVEAFKQQVKRLWARALRRRSQRTRLTWDRFNRLERKWLPRIRNTHPYPEQRFLARHPRQEPSAAVPLAGTCAGGRPSGRSLPRSCSSNTCGTVATWVS
jgi:RNA-directed DNA polymerase